VCLSYHFYRGLHCGGRQKAICTGDYIEREGKRQSAQGITLRGKAICTGDYIEREGNLHRGLH